MELKFRANIDLEFIDKASDELFKLLANQNYEFSKRWYDSFVVIKIVPILRWVGLFGSLLGIVLCVFVLMLKPTWCPLWLNAGLFVIFFIVTTVLFVFFPKLEASIKKWSRRYAAKGCKKYSIRVMKQARKLTPFIAEYDIKGDLITYYRGKDNNWNIAWNRKLKGIAYQGYTQTVIFKKATSFYPVIIILHADSKPMQKVLKELGINIKTIPKSLPQDYLVS